MTPLFVSLTYCVVLGLLGLAMGSFLNVAAYRAPKGISLLRPPSSCPACGNRIAARDNIPVFGYLILGGKCRNCRQPIPPRYLIAELATGLLWAAAGWKIAQLDFGSGTNVAVGLAWLAFVSAAVVTFIVDCDYMIILDEISLGGAALAVAAAAAFPAIPFVNDTGPFILLAGLMPSAPPWVVGLGSSLLGAAAGLGFSAAVLYLGNAAFRRQIEEARKHDPEVRTALGWGDVKLMAFYGAFLGWFSVLTIFVMASILGAVIGSARKLRIGGPAGLTGWEGLKARWRGSDSVLPFGPFLASAAVAQLFFAPQIHALLLGNAAGM